MKSAQKVKKKHTPNEQRQKRWFRCQRQKSDFFENRLPSQKRVGGRPFSPLFHLYPSLLIYGLLYHQTTFTHRVLPIPPLPASPTTPPTLPPPQHLPPLLSAEFRRASLPPLPHSFALLPAPKIYYIYFI